MYELIVYSITNVIINIIHPLYQQPDSILDTFQPGDTNNQTICLLAFSLTMHLLKEMLSIH